MTHSISSSIQNQNRVVGQNTNDTDTEKPNESASFKGKQNLDFLSYSSSKIPPANHFFLLLVFYLFIFLFFKCGYVSCLIHIGKNLFQITIEVDIFLLFNLQSSSPIYIV